MLFDIPTKDLFALLKDKKHGDWLHDKLFDYHIYPENEEGFINEPVAWAVTEVTEDGEEFLTRVFANREDAKDFTENSDRNLTLQAVEWGRPYDSDL